MILKLTTSHEAIRRKRNHFWVNLCFANDKETFFGISLPFCKIKWWKGWGWGWGLLCFWRLFEKIKDCRHLPFFCVHACCRSSRVAFSRVLAHFPLSTITEGNKVFWIRSSVHPFKRIRIFAVESGILCFGIRKTFQGLRNPSNDGNPESKFHCRNPVSLKSGIQDYLGFLYMGRFSGTTTK